MTKGSEEWVLSVVTSCYVQMWLWLDLHRRLSELLISSMNANATLWWLKYMPANVCFFHKCVSECECVSCFCCPLLAQIEVVSHKILKPCFNILGVQKRKKKKNCSLMSFEFKESAPRIKYK